MKNEQEIYQLITDLYKSSSAEESLALSDRLVTKLVETKLENAFFHKRVPFADSEQLYSPFELLVFAAAGFIGTKPQDVKNLAAACPLLLSWLFNNNKFTTSELVYAKETLSLVADSITHPTPSPFEEDLKMLKAGPQSFDAQVQNLFLVNKTRETNITKWHFECVVHFLISEIEGYKQGLKSDHLVPTDIEFHLKEKMLECKNEMDKLMGMHGKNFELLKELFSPETMEDPSKLENIMLSGMNEMSSNIPGCQPIVADDFMKFKEEVSNIQKKLESGNLVGSEGKNEEEFLVSLVEKLSINDKIPAFPQIFKTGLSALNSFLKAEEGSSALISLLKAEEDFNVVKPPSSTTAANEHPEDLDAILEKALAELHSPLIKPTERATTLLPNIDPASPIRPNIGGAADPIVEKVLTQSPRGIHTAFNSIHNSPSVLSQSASQQSATHIATRKGKGRDEQDDTLITTKSDLKKRKVTLS